MIVIFAAAVVAVGQAESAPEPAPTPIIYEAEFKPLPKSERRTAFLGPAGPFYPQAAMEAHKNGEAILDCVTAPMGTLEKCKAISEMPVGYFFGAAAEVMADRKRIIVAPLLPLGQSIKVHVAFTRGAPTVIAP